MEEESRKDLARCTLLLTQFTRGVIALAWLSKLIA